MKESIPENESPLNQKSKEFLLKEKEIPNPVHLYCLQLAIWGMKNGLAVDWEVEENLYQMLSWNPKKVMNALEYPDPDSQEDWLDLLDGHNKPIDLAWSILDRVWDFLTPILGLNPLRTGG